MNVPIGNYIRRMFEAHSPAATDASGGTNHQRPQTQVNEPSGIERKDTTMIAANTFSHSNRTNHELATPTDLIDGIAAISAELRTLLADVFALYLKIKNFHWHMTGPHFRDYHLMMDEHADQVFAMTDELAERARKIGGTTLRSIGDVARHQRLQDNDDDFVSPNDMLSELIADNQHLVRSLRSAHLICEKYDDVATASLIENWIDEGERRTWFLAMTVGPRS